jgi:hypothetical protein
MSQPKSPARFEVIVDDEGTNRAKFRNKITVNTRRHWEAQQHSAGPYESRPLGFTLDIDLGEDASVADRRRLIGAAAKGCFIEQTLKPGIAKHRLKAGGDWVEL